MPAPTRALQVIVAISVIVSAGCSQKGGVQEKHFAIVQLATRDIRTIQFDVAQGQAIFEGDIVFGDANALDQRFRQARTFEDKTRFAVAINGPQFRWPELTIPYVVDASTITEPQLTAVYDAIDEWNALLSARGLGRPAWVPRTPGQADYVKFRRLAGDDCNSSVGRQGGVQFINLILGCRKGQIEHEMGHAMGLWHEQSRGDRDSFVRINYANIRAGKELNFNQHIWDGGYIRSYDYDSIMHYGAYDFAVNTSIPTIESPKPIGQRNAPDAADVDGVWIIHERAGWGVRICDGTQAGVIRLDIGYVENGTRRSRPWFRWMPGFLREFAVPADLLFKQTLWIAGEGEPHDQIEMCIVYNGDQKQGMSFNKDENKQVDQSEHTDQCRC